MSRLRRNNFTNEKTNTVTDYTPKVYNFYNTPEAKPQKPIHISKVRYDNRPRSYEKKSNKPATFYQEAPKTRTLYASEEDNFLRNGELNGYRIEQMLAGKVEPDWDGKYNADTGKDVCKGLITLGCKALGKMAHFSSFDGEGVFKDIPIGSLNAITNESKNIKHITEQDGAKVTLSVLVTSKRKDDVYMVRTREVTEKELKAFNSSQGLIKDYGDGLQFGDANESGEMVKVEGSNKMEMKGHDYVGFEQLISGGFHKNNNVQGGNLRADVDGEKDSMYWHSFEIKIVDDNQAELNEVLVAEILSCKKDKKTYKIPYVPDQVIDRVYIVIKDDDRPKFDHKEGEKLIVNEGDEAVIEISGKDDVTGLFLKARPLNDEEIDAYCGDEGMYVPATFKGEDDELDVKEDLAADGKLANCNQELQFKNNKATVKIQTYNDEDAGKDKLFAVDIVDKEGKIYFSKPMLVCIDDSDDRPSFDKTIYWVKEEEGKLEIKVSASEGARIGRNDWKFSTADATEEDVKTLSGDYDSWDDLLSYYNNMGEDVPASVITEIETNLGVDKKELMEYKELYYQIKKNIRNKIEDHQNEIPKLDTSQEEGEKKKKQLNDEITKLQDEINTIDSWQGFGRATGEGKEADYVKVEPRSLPPDFSKEPTNECTFTVTINDDEAVEKEECFIIKIENQQGQITSKAYVVITDFHDRLKELRNHPHRNLQKMDKESADLLTQLQAKKADATDKKKGDEKEMDYKSAMITLYRENKKLRAKLKKRRK